MATTATDDLHPCECGCGTPVAGRWARGHWARVHGFGGRGAPDQDDPENSSDSDIPDEPDEEWDDEPVRPAGAFPGYGQPGPAPAPPREIWDREGDSSWFVNRDTGERRDMAEDTPPEPAHLRPGERGGRGKRATRARAKPAVVPATVRRDVTAKIRAVTMPAGQAWQFRDPLCGGKFAEQEKEAAEAFAEIVCDSPELLAWFMTGGQYMKFFRLFMALLPVGVTVYGHHLAHREAAESTTDPRAQAPVVDYSRFAA